MSLTGQKKAERRAITRRVAAATAIHKAFESRFYSSLMVPFQFVRNAQSQLSDLMERRKKLRLYASRRMKDECYNCIERIARSARRALDDLRFMEKPLEEFMRVLSGTAVTATPDINSLCGHLEAIERDFPQWRFKDDKLIVRTERIVLNHPDRDFSVDLGEFEIELRMDELHDDRYDRPYHIRAVNPVRPKRGQTDYFHPHVTGRGTLCEGDAAAGIDISLRLGRLYDFFVVVNQTLSTYNPDSPYLKLAYWTSDEHEGDMEEEDEDEDDLCPICEEPMGESSALCEDCRETMCEEHLNYCELAEMHICDTCLGFRRSSGRPYCADSSQWGAEGCLLRENEPCESCGQIVGDANLFRCQNSGITVCKDCARDARNIPSGKAYTDIECACEFIGTKHCALVNHYGLPSFSESVPKGCVGCKYAGYGRCLVITGEVPLDHEEESDERETSQKKEEVSEDDGPAVFAGCPTGGRAVRAGAAGSHTGNSQAVVEGAAAAS